MSSSAPQDQKSAASVTSIDDQRGGDEGDLAAEQAKAAVDVLGEDREETIDDAGAAHGVIRPSVWADRPMRRRARLRRPARSGTSRPAGFRCGDASRRKRRRFSAQARRQPASCAPASPRSWQRLSSARRGSASTAAASTMRKGRRLSIAVPDLDRGRGDRQHDERQRRRSVPPSPALMRAVIGGTS